MATRFWLVKSEPGVFSFADLLRSPNQTTCWDGVRNYQARNMLRDEMAVGEQVLFYHSRVAPMAVVGITTVERAGYPDPSQFDPKSAYFDAAAPRGRPRWFAVDLRAERPLSPPITLARMHQLPELEGMVLLQKGSRLSVQPVRPKEYSAILAAAGSAATAVPASRKEGNPKKS